MAERFLVTGCAGFIGGHLLRRLLADGAEVAGVDDFSTGARENLADLKGRFTFIEGDLAAPGVAERACEGVTHVFHEAAVPSVPRSVDRPLASLESTVTATVRLLLAARDAGARRVVVAGSSSVYGDTEELPKREDMPPRPRSPYAVAKLAQEHYARVFSLCYGLDAVTLRYFNVFGPRQNPDGAYAAAIPRFITAIARGERPVIYGDGEQTRDFTYIDNVVDANLAAARHPAPLEGAAFNAALGCRVSLNQLVAAINRLLDRNVRPDHQAPRRGDVRDSLAATEAIQRVIGWRGTVPFEEGLRRTVEFFR
jgi:UDP-glucose 4-epimerase